MHVVLDTSISVFRLNIEIHVISVTFKVEFNSVSIKPCREFIKIFITACAGLFIMILFCSSPMKTKVNL